MEKAIIFLALAAALGGCASPTLNTSPDAERSFDGLYPFEHTAVDAAWGRADLDLTGYKRVKLEGAGIQYRPITSAAARSRTAALRSGETDFPISEENRARLQETVREAFEKELAKLETFEVTNEVGPDVLLVRGALIDVVSHVPPDPISGRTEIYLRSVGEATLVLEMIDSESNAVLIRAVDRRAAEQQGMAVESSTVQNWSEVRQLALTWARLLRNALEELAAGLTLEEEAG